jgi:hypothetical protein
MTFGTCRATGGNLRRLIGTAVCRPARTVVWEPGLTNFGQSPATRLESKLLYALDTINLIDRECSLCKPFNTLPDRIQVLIHARSLDSNAGNQAKMREHF